MFAAGDCPPGRSRRARIDVALHFRSLSARRSLRRPGGTKRRDNPIFRRLSPTRQQQRRKPSARLAHSSAEGAGWRVLSRGRATGHRDEPDALLND